MIFARKTDDGLASLVKKIDAKVAENKDKKMKSFVAFLGEDKEALKEAVEKFAEKSKVKEIPLTIPVEQPNGPESYSLNEEAVYTILLYKDPTAGVIVNHALKKGELTAKKVEAIVKDTAKILE